MISTRNGLQSVFPLLISIFFVFLGCKKNTSEEQYNQFDPAFEGIVAGYTTGEISRSSPILVQFTRAMISESQVSNTIDPEVFSLSPAVKGTARWKTPFTLEFTPETVLESGKEYKVTLRTSTFNDSIPELPTAFYFKFRTIPQALNVELAGLRTIDMDNFDWQHLSGTISTIDYEPNENIEQMFSARLKNSSVSISWEHEQDNYVHTFHVDSIPRFDKEEQLEIVWNGESSNVPLKGKRKVDIPQRGAFVLLDHYVVNHPQQYIQLIFSDPVNQQQNLKGIVYVREMDTRISVNSNQIRIYPSGQVSGTYQLKVEPGIENLAGKRLNNNQQFEVTFEDPLPQVRLVGEGVIIPQSSTLPFIFETIGLKAIDVRIIKVYQQNVLQFFQASTLNQNNEINRVGQVIENKTLTFGSNVNTSQGQWTRHTLDLREMIEPAPGAIYEIALGFRPAHVLNPCASQIEESEQINMLKVSDNYNSLYWYDSDDYYYYDWNQRDNPCDRAYYRRDRVVKRNVLASEIGMMVKKSEKDHQIILTNIKTTDPLGGAEVELFDFQQQLIGKGISDSEGKIIIPVDSSRKSYMAVAKFGDQRGYLRLDESNSMSLSRFDIGGSQYQQGLKGFIYGERGVWRPGEDIFLTFILEDKQDRLPDDHPVSFEFSDPQGKVISKMVKTESLRGFYTFPVKTNPNAPTGNYRATIQVGGAQFGKTVKVETITPNRLKIRLDYGTSTLSARTKNSSSMLQASWLHGAPARNLQANVHVSLRPKKTSFNTYADFVFDDPVRLFDMEEMVLFDGKLNENGIAQIPSDLSLENNPPGMLSANFRTQVFEPGGNFSIDQFNIDYSPYNVYVGIKTPETDRWGDILDLNEPHAIEVATLDMNGKPVSRNDLQLEIYKLEWKWWWDRSYNDLANYQGKVYSDPIQSELIKTVNGKGSWTLKINEPDWGRYLIRIKDREGHSTGKVVYVDYPGWRGRSGSGGNEGAKMLSFTADKDSYEVGETVTLNVPTGFSGRALISIEQGADILESHWIEAKEGMTQYSFKTTPEMAPNIYVHITLLQPHAQTENDLPIRMYGVIPVFVEDPDTHLEPEISMPDQLAPNEEVSIRISEAEGKPMTYTLAMIDEGLLDITRYQTPDPHKVFYLREALHVKTWDIFDQVVASYAGEMGNLLSIGGDGAESINPDASKQNRFKPVVKYLGPFYLEKGKSTTHTIEMPNYVGSVKTMVVAGDKGAYGHAEKMTPVKKPLMVLGSLPRVLGPEETLKLPTTVFVMDDKIKNVKIKVETNELLEVQGAREQNIAMQSVGDQVLNFDLKVKPLLGTGHIKITATSGREVAIYETDIDIRLPNPPVTEVISATLAPGQTWSQRYTPLGVQGTNQGMLELSSIPPLNLGKRLNYLIRYPYGCLEQTTSSAFPQIYLSRLLDLDDKQKRSIDGNVRAAIDRIRRFQLGNGGFAYWPGNRSANTWSTNYVGHFLLEAQNAGYYVPQDMLNDWKNYQRDKANSWTGQAPTPWYEQAEQLSQAYRLYLLAKAGIPNIGAMNRLRQESNLYLVAKYHLAAAYYLAGQQRISDKIRNGLDTNVPEYKRVSYTYGSALRDRAIMLDALCTMDAKDEANELVSDISDRLSSSNWLSTHTTAFCLVAMARYVGRENPAAGMQFSIAKNGASAENKEEQAAIWQQMLDPEIETGVNITNESDQMLFVRLISEGTPLKGDERSTSNGVSMSVKYTQLNGEILDPANIPQGTEFFAEVAITNVGKKGTYEDMVLNQIFPSGWEIYNSRLYNIENGGDEPTYQDIRDDRIYTFFDLPEGKTKKYIFRLQATYQGKYYLPVVYSEAMYDYTINARRGGRWVNVVSPPEG